MSRSGFAAVLALTVTATLIPAPRAARAACPTVDGVSATDGTICNGVRVSWQSEVLGTGFRVHRGLDPGGSDRTLLGSSPGRSYLDGTAVPGVVYYYWVQHYGGICSVASPLGTPDTGYHGTPLAPTGVQASNAQYCGKVRVTWNALANAASYDVFRSPTSDLLDATLVGDTTGTTFDDGTIDERFTYYYWVRGRTAQGCLGELPQSGKAGRSIPPLLADLSLDPGNSNVQPYITTNAAGRRVVQFPTSIRNGGTAPLLLETGLSYWDGTSDMYQKALACNGQTKQLFLGRFVDEDDHVKLPHFVRARLRKRVLPSGDPGEVVAQVDVPGRCFEDNYVWNAQLPGSPATQQFHGCVPTQQGISIGWYMYGSAGAIGHELDLGCVTADYYWFELTVDPDNMIRELDESNNTVRTLINFAGQPPFPIPTACTGPQVEGWLIAPDSILAGEGAETDSITGRVWIAGLTEAQGPNPLTVAQIGYAPMTTFDTAAWTWGPAQWRRQDGAEDVYGGTITAPPAGEYVYAMRFQVFDGPWMMADSDGSLNGFSYFKAGPFITVPTTGVGDGAATGAPLAFDALTDPARGATRFRVSLPSASNLVVSLYDVLGRRVRTLERGPAPAGVHHVDWDGRDDAGRTAARGIYLARLEASPGGRLTTKFFAGAR